MLGAVCVYLAAISLCVGLVVATVSCWKYNDGWGDIILSLLSIFMGLVFIVGIVGQLLINAGYFQ